MALYTQPAPIRTGMRAREKTGTPIHRQRRALGIPRVLNPALPADARSYGFRASRMDTKAPYDFKAITNAYLMDAFVRQGVDKYVEMVLKEGYYLHGAPEAVAYLTMRLDLMTAMREDGRPWQEVIEQAVRDLIQYGNALLLCARSPRIDAIPGVALRSLHGKLPIGAYFNLPVDQMTPVFDPESHRLTAWKQTLDNETRTFPAQDVLHFAYCRKSGSLWGTPSLLSCIEDVRALRQAEEAVLRLLDKHLNPLIHQTVPDITGTGEGRQEDVDEAAALYQSMAPDGFIITPPGNEVKVIGAESKALRAEAYLQYFKSRVYAGLGVSELIMGENSGGSASSADALNAQMHHRSKYYQIILSTVFSTFILNELLMEGGYDPWNAPEDRVTWAWHELEIDRRIKEETHALSQWTMNGITRTELRERLRLGPLDEEDETDTYSERVQIPQLTAVHRLLRADIQMDPDSPRGDDAPRAGKVPLQRITRAGGQADNLLRPANQHGKKFSPGAARAHKLAAGTAGAVLAWTERYRAGRASAIDLTYLLSASLGACPPAVYRAALAAARGPDPARDLAAVGQAILRCCGAGPDERGVPGPDEPGAPCSDGHSVPGLDERGALAPDERGVPGPDL